jgi:thymidylate synthase
MHIVRARNVEEALLLGVDMIDDLGVQRDSRNGPVKVMPYPVTTVYERPRERVMFLPERDCNPFFHFMECLWMMAGRRDVEWISRFNNGMANYTDDGVNFHGAYGYRWRNHFPDGEFVIDQLATIANLLKANPDDRRTVLQMWDASSDLGFEGKDFPCNLIITFRINVAGHLDMTVFNRSNDMVWGAYGANAVHMSFMQEVMASWIGVPVGLYWQISTNFHAYLETLKKVEPLLSQSAGFTDYELDNVKPFNIVNSPIDTWFSELSMFMEDGANVMGYTDPFFKRVAVPMMLSWEKWKDKSNPDRVEMAIASAENIAATDWQKACIEWLERKA